MTIEEVRKKLTDILNKGSQNAGCNNSDVENKNDTDADKIEPEVLEDYQKIFGGIISTKYLLNTRRMTRKEYLAYSKNLTQQQILNHPLLYCMFRAEGQLQFNFLEWLAEFKR